MANQLTPQPDMIYQIRLKGHLGSQWADWFDGLSITLEDSGDTLLTGPVADQAALHGLLKFVSALLFLATAWSLYVLLRPVNANLALLFLLLNTVGVGIQCASMLPLVAAMLLGDGAGGMQAYSAAQLEGLSYLAINTYRTGFVTAQLFFGTWLFPLGYLVYKSEVLPRFLGVLLLLDGVAVMIWFLQALLLPDYHAIIIPGLVVSFVAEFGLALWLLVRGVPVGALHSRSSGAAA